MSIVVENLNHIYDIGSPYETNALDNVSLSIEKGAFSGIIGHTGSGKSTLIQHLNGLLKPTSGRIIIDGLDITAKSTKLLDVRKKIGLVFQYPEYQLFEETVEKDIAFGPMNLGLPKEEVEARVKEFMETVGLSYEDLKDKSPFELSGGQKRRVAIAGVLAMKPEVLILDEPTAGLDPRGREEILGQMKKLHEKYGMTIVLVSHSMEDVARFVDKLYVMHQGGIELSGTPREVFKHADRLCEIGLGIPQVTELAEALKAKGVEFSCTPITVEETRDVILDLIRSKSHA